SLALHIHHLCLRFQDAWSAGQRPRIEDYMAEAQDAERPALFQKLLPLELALRRSIGETPDAGEYLKRFPDLVAVVEAAFGAAAASAEGAGGAEASHQSVSTGPPALGAPDAEAPARLGRYHILAKLGAGSFGVVYKGYDDDLRRVVAIKVARR